MSQSRGISLSLNYFPWPVVNHSQVSPTDSIPTKFIGSVGGRSTTSWGIFGKESLRSPEHVSLCFELGDAAFGACAFLRHEMCVMDIKKRRFKLS
jgi:hypothetical protein